MLYVLFFVDYNVYAFQDVNHYLPVRPRFLSHSFKTVCDTHQTVGRVIILHIDGLALPLWWR